MCCIGASLSSNFKQFFSWCPTQSPCHSQPTTQYSYSPMINSQVHLFCGEKDSSGHVEDPETWLNHFERMSITNGWSTDLQKKQHFQVYLTGEAEAWYMVNQKLINN